MNPADELARCDREIAAMIAQRWCWKPDGQLVVVALDGTGRWHLYGAHAWISPRGTPVQMRGVTASCVIRCRLTVAHLDHNPANNDLDNLAALCQRCHLVYDGPHHRRTARLRRDRETGQLRMEWAA